MASTHSVVRLRTPDSGYFATYDSFGQLALSGNPNVQSEQITVVGPAANVNSAFLLPVGVRAAILGVGVSFTNAATANSTLQFQMSRAVNVLAVTTDDGLGVYNTVLPRFFISVGV